MGVVHLIFIFMLVIEISLGQIIIPKEYDGFPLYNSKNKDEGSIMVEAFFDPLCPDSRDSWPPLKQALQYYSPHLSFIFHPFPLPYHSNAYIASLALHIANNLNSSTTFPLLELFFKFQEKYYNDPTFNMSRAMVTDDITNLAISLIGKSYSQAFKAGFQDPQTNEAQKISFKYGCSRGVASTPTFLVNGFTLPGAGAAIPFQQWKSIIDPLLKNF